MAKRSCSVYLIDKYSVENKNTSSEITKKIIREINKDISEKAEESSRPKHLYKKQRVGDEWQRNKMKVELFFRQHIYVPEWRGFISGITEMDSPINRAENKSSSFICFIYNEDNIFVVCTGSGSSAISKYIDYSFGLEILMKLINENSKVIKSLRKRGITGNTLAASQIFKKDQIILSEETYGQLFKELTADLDCNTIYQNLGLDIGNRSDANCVAKSSFKISKSIDFEGLISFVNHLERIKNSEFSGFNINRLVQVNKRSKSGSKLIENLSKQLKKNLYKHLKSSSHNLGFEICHQNYEKYFFAEKYQIRIKSKNGGMQEYDNRISYSDIRKFLKLHHPQAIKTQKEFLKIVDKLRISSFDENGNLLTDGEVFTHLNGEIVYLSKTYFFIDNSWIQMKGNLVEELDKDVLVLLNDMDKEQKLNAIKLPRWDKGIYPVEDDYNASFLGGVNSLVFHKVLYKNIEMADVLVWDENEMKLIHVKSGFDSSMRDLVSQIDNSARILINEKKSNKYDFAHAMYDRLEEIRNPKNNKEFSKYNQSISKQIEFISRNDFINLFKSRDISYCLAVLDSSKKRNIKELEKYESNIAKLSLLDLIRNMSSLSTTLYIEEI